MKTNKSGFSIIELLVGIFIFSLGLTGVYALIISTMSMNEYSKNSIIASSLAKSSIEDIVNMRDSNYKNYYLYNKLPGNNVNNKILTGTYYKIESDLNESNNNLIKIDKITPFKEGKSEILNMSNYKLYLDGEKNYTYESTGNKPTIFYRYVVFDDLYENTKYITGALKITSKVIWYSKGYHEVELKSIITDWQRN